MTLTAGLVIWRGLVWPNCSLDATVVLESMALSDRHGHWSQRGPGLPLSQRRGLEGDLVHQATVMRQEATARSHHWLRPLYRPEPTRSRPRTLLTAQGEFPGVPSGLERSTRPLGQQLPPSQAPRILEMLDKSSLVSSAGILSDCLSPFL